MAHRWTRGSAEAEDIAQEALLLYLNCSLPPRTPTAWLAVVVRRLSHRERLRALARHQAETTFHADTSIYVRGRDVETEIDTKAALQMLPERDRLLLTAVGYGVGSRGLAELFGCNVRDVGQMVARARRKARKFAGRGEPRS